MIEENELAKIYRTGAGLDAASPIKNPEFKALVAYVESGERGMQTKCPHCGSLARIRSSKQVSALVKEATCQCGNVVCGHTFIVNVEVVRTISPPAFPDPLVASQLRQSKRWIGLRRDVNAEDGEHFAEVPAMT